MSVDLEIHRAASDFIDRHGEDAAIEAAVRSVKLLRKGEIDGYLLWEHMVQAIDRIQRGDGVLG